jgi:hypothetical protein
MDQKTKDPEGQRRVPWRSAAACLGGARTESQETFARELESGQPSSLPLWDYLARAVEEYQAWDRHLRPELWEAWQSELFYLVRLLKAHPDLAKLTARQALTKVEQVMHEWACKDRGAGAVKKADRLEYAWLKYLGAGREDAHAEVMDAWDKVRYLPGFSPLANAVELADRCPLRLLAETKQRRTDGYERFISVAGWLQVSMGDRDIMLPVHELAPLLDVDPMTISRYRKWAKEDGFLREVAPHEFKGKGKKGKATTFRFDVSRVPVLMERAQDGSVEASAGRPTGVQTEIGRAAS